MKGFMIAFVVVFLAVTAESASHHKKHKAGKNVKDNEVVPTTPGDDTWPSPASIGDFEVPDKFHEDGGSGESEEKSIKQHRRSSHRSHSN